ncbi:Uncharacterised protein [Streptococcus suis]|uniref:Uncharacterized protein n=1 Tax=Streptococcus suis TaxID=1307 RepID=A0A123T4Y3_STRSU|nr:Uncharacterised protein [Streptococcus suis]
MTEFAMMNKVYGEAISGVIEITVTWRCKRA